MKQVDLYGRVRHAVLIEGISQRESARLSFRLLPATYRTLWVSDPPIGPSNFLRSVGQCEPLTVGVAQSRKYLAQTNKKGRFAVHISQ